MDTSVYNRLSARLSGFLPEERIISNYAQRLAMGVDASFYRLVPKLVLILDTEDEVIRVMKEAAALGVAVTFRAAGTSLSGQAQSDSVLITLTNRWRSHEIQDLGLKIKLGPGVIGADANKYLLPYGRKLGPDPASINTCKIGGIAANNASGMCCGVAQNSYHTLASIRVVLHDGTVLDTADEQSIEAFRSSHAVLLRSIGQLAAEVCRDAALHELISHKYRLKNTTGYAINSLIDFTDPIDMLAHLMIGSEGTLGFISSITYHTVKEEKYRATSMVFFPDIHTTCLAVNALAAANVAAVELLDRRSLASVCEMQGLPDFIHYIEDGVAALLIETRAANRELLAQQVDQLQTLLSGFTQVNCIPFTDDSERCAQLWAIRKGTFPAVGAVRENGTTVIIEDVAFPLARLADGVAALQSLFDRYQYHEAIIFGHALEGNLHFVFTQDFSTQAEIDRYSMFMESVCELVAVDFQGSLKAEHGTGRNMAPFLELEWGATGVAIMKSIKRLFDPRHLLNPGVIINENPLAHITHLKALPGADSIIDKCIECGFCEPVCPSKDLSFTPRQRITVFREISRLQDTKEDPARLAELNEAFEYSGIDTCAATGLCADRCPVGINTGDFVRARRQLRNQKHQRTATFLATHFASLERISRFSLLLLSSVQKLIGNQAMSKLSGALRALSRNTLPQWSAYMPQRAHPKQPQKVPVNAAEAKTVVYMPSCASRTMGQSLDAADQRSLTEVTLALLEKAGFTVISPDFAGECCGMPFQSKGLPVVADQKKQSLLARLEALSKQGTYPILLDTSPCKSMLQGLETQALSIYEPVGFISEILAPHLNFRPTDETVMLHITCSSRRMGLADQMHALAMRCSNRVVIPEHIYCCGFAGDKGFATPELNASALSVLKEQVPEGCQVGYSNSRTCEIGLSHHAGITYQSILYLVDNATSANISPPVNDGNEKSLATKQL